MEVVGEAEATIARRPTSPSPTTIVWPDDRPIRQRSYSAANTTEAARSTVLAAIIGTTKRAI